LEVTRDERYELRESGDIVRVRQQARAWAVEIGFSLVDQTKIVTATSELARNTIEHGKGGTARLRALVNGSRKGLRLDFEDSGPGIANMELALSDGYTTGTGLGLGLSGSRRLMNEFEIESDLGAGWNGLHQTSPST
jgi:serine/threonine-protein kinase RsbT